ncbi:hypothetical protein AAHC03_019354 [Spirometra sp. Aus1]
MEAFYGSWELESSGDVSAIAKSLGVTLKQERLAQMSNSVLEFSPADAGRYNMEVKMGPMTHHVNFKLDEEFQHTTLDGRSVKMVMKLDGNKLTIDQRGDKAMLIEDVVDGKNLTVTLKVGDVSCVRRYTKV